MKKHIFWIVPLVLYIFLVVLNSRTTYFNRNWFNVKHVLFFGLFVYVLIISLYLVYRFFIMNYIKMKFIKIILGLLLCTIAITGTVTASNLQMIYIDKYEIPHLSECTYFDRYANIIYEDIIETCPELNIIIDTQDTLSFTVEENYTGTLREPISVDDGIGFVHYEANVNLKVQVDITYHGPYVESLIYTEYEVIEKVNSNKVTGFMLKESMAMSYDIDNQVTITYITQELELDLTDIDQFPSFDSIEPVVKRYVSTHIIEEDSEINDTQIIVFDEITFDEEGLEVVNNYGIGKFERINDPLISVDFYENGTATGNSTDFYFDHNETTIRNREERRQVAGVERQYDVRTLIFNQSPAALNDGYEILHHTLMFSSFEAELKYAWEFDYLSENSLKMINDELYIYDGDYYNKLVFTDYGFHIDKYFTNQFSWNELFPDESDSEIIDYSISISHFNGNRINKLLQIYDYKKAVMTPGYLSNSYFYQHNFLIEHVFLDNYGKFEEK